MTSNYYRKPNVTHKDFHTSAHNVRQNITTEIINAARNVVHKLNAIEFIIHINLIHEVSKSESELNVCVCVMQGLKSLHERTELILI